MSFLRVAWGDEPHVPKPSKGFFHHYNLLEFCKLIYFSLNLAKNKLKVNNMIRIKLIYLDYMIFSSMSGPILNLTWDEFEEIERSNQELTTNRHKTGKIHTVHIFIQDQRRFLRAMRAKYIE